MTRFLHTSDLQLGMTRHFLSEEAQARFSQARIDAVRTLARLAQERGCRFAVVAGDVFESNQLDRRTVARALDAFRAFSVPVYLLPGNHDPLDAASVFRSAAFTSACPPHLHVLDDATPREVEPGVEVVGAPWTSKRPLADLVARACESLASARGAVRVMVAHGAVDVLSPDADDPARIALAAAERALAEERIHYLALGDRHSTTDVGGSGRVRYSGAPEPTDFREVDPGNALVVSLDGGRCEVEAVRVGTWRFDERAYLLDDASHVEHLARELDALPDRERTVLRLSFRGALSLAAHARLEELLARARDVFAGVDLWERHTDLVVRPEDADFAALDVAGFARAALDDLRRTAGGDGDEARTARDALALLVRLAGRRA